MSHECPNRLFEPIRVGSLTLSHRIVYAPLTRFRNDDAHVPTEIMVQHYAQRASVAGTLLITEATYVSHKAGHFSPNAPGVYNEE